MSGTSSVLSPAEFEIVGDAVRAVWTCRPTSAIVDTAEWTAIPTSTHTVVHAITTMSLISWASRRAGVVA